MQFLEGSYRQPYQNAAFLDLPPNRTEGSDNIIKSPKELEAYGAEVTTRLDYRGPNQQYRGIWFESERNAKALFR